VKSNKSLNAFFVTIFVAAIILAINFDHFSNERADSSPLEKIEEKSRPLQGIETEESSSAIIQLLKKDNRTLADKSAAENYADYYKDIQLTEAALKHFYSSDDRQDRESALITLGEYPDTQAKDAILYALNDPEDNVREQAVRQISKWRDEKERQEMLLEALYNDSPDIVVLALASIAESDNPTLLEKIKALSIDNNEDIKNAAKIALEILGLE
jgi:HEAT repeat protein